MAIGIQMDFAGGTLDQYDQVMDKMQLSPEKMAGFGAIFHWVAQTDGGIRVTDVWQTREAFDAFAQTQIGPFTQEVGMAGPPEIQFFDVHNYLGAG